MKNFFIALGTACAFAISVILIKELSLAQKAAAQQPGKTSDKTARLVAANAGAEANAPLFVTEIPPGYRDWRLISVAREEGELNDIRAVLGNDLAIQACREGKGSFPDGAIIARLAWSLDASEVNNKSFGRAQSFVAGPPKNGVQFMIKDAKRYAATGGWGYGHFNDGKPAGAATMQSCFPCHQAIQARDFIFTLYAP